MSTNQNQSNNDKLLLAAIDLMAEKGYNGVSTKEIAAAAGLSEMTLFRNFGSKQNLLESAFDRFHYAEEMKKLFSEKMVWDLEKDLLLVSRTYHEIMNRNRKMFMISMKDGGQLPGFHEKARKHPNQLKEVLTNYFEAMADKGKLVHSNPELQALSFMWMNYGAFISNTNSFEGVTLEAFISESVGLFTRALTP